MATYVFSYRNPKGYAPSPETRAQWFDWFEGMGDALVNIGQPVSNRSSLGNCDSAEYAGGNRRCQRGPAAGAGPHVRRQEFAWWPAAILDLAPGGRGMGGNRGEAARWPGSARPRCMVPDGEVGSADGW